ncbi:MAG: rhodanese-like domain-containing protein [bacterium]
MTFSKMTAITLSSITLLAGGCAPAAETGAASSSEESTVQPIIAFTYDYLEAPAVREVIKQADGITILDIRTPREYQSGHIDNAINLDFYDQHFSEKLADLDRDKSYVVYCQSGGRSSKAMKLIKQLQFKQVTHLNGGFSAWKRAGYEVVSE